jgi:hypothetical protein
MATFDMTSSATAGVNSNSIAVNQANRAGTGMRMVEAILDISKITDYSCTDGDIFQLLEIPAGTFVLFAGAEVLTAFDGIIDGGDVSSAGFLAEGTNGQANDVVTGAASTFTQHVTTTDTIDVKLIAGSADVTTGKLRLYACIIDTNGEHKQLADEVDRDQLA